jgi:hypothetical protein
VVSFVSSLSDERTPPKANRSPTGAVSQPQRLRRKPRGLRQHRLPFAIALHQDLCPANPRGASSHAVRCACSLHNCCHHCRFSIDTYLEVRILE